ncbi:Adenosine 3'-phospho 5'-phosphosulfate transporter 1 (PAPS transporter 1) (Solute carrier family 35 member B2) [Durusdinium trenchii]|uniref:Adenosine 3'-phospho 5'-phosphosulfate transporter 1 (PAPS transporter 1) (Solute carrier family 35 member B2) n=1 Tax=Durusdinium trenchii TaxID=1381693 RepID=A0ABP0J8M6_9DINO
MENAQTQTHPAWCGIYGVGIIFFLVLYGIFQEGIMTVPYDGVLFKYSVFLVLCNRLAAVIFGLAMAVAKGEKLTNQAPLWKYLIVSLSNVYASTCQYEALKYVSFAVQMLGKSFKMMPVMIWGMIISGKSYGLRDWGVALAVTLGCTEFLMTGPTNSKVDSGNSMWGFVLLGGFLALDGLTSTFQEKLFKEHQTTKYNQMVYINSLSATVSTMTLLVTGDLMPAHPKFLLDSTLLSGSAVASQWCIYSQVKEFGALVFAATMNVRQVVSILVSYVKYHNPVTGLQIVGLVIIFAALSWKSLSGLLKAQDPEKKPLKAQDAADCAACVTALLGKVHGLVVAKVARTAPSLAPGLAAGGPGRTMPGTLRALHTALLFEGQPSGGTTTPVQAMMQNPESKMEGQVHWPDQEGCYAGCAADSMAGGKTYGSLTPPHFFKEPDEEAEVPDAPGAPLPSGALAPRRQKVCDMLGRITGAYQGKFCQGPDACVTALPRDFGQVTGATFCPKGDCGEKAGRPWCVSPQFLKLYDGPIEPGLGTSGPGGGNPSGCWWFLRNEPGKDTLGQREHELNRLPGVIVWKNAPDTRLLKRSGVGLKMSEARLWATTGQLVNPSDFAAEGTDVTSWGYSVLEHLVPR